MTTFRIVCLTLLIALPVLAQDNPRIYIEASESWTRESARPQRAEIIKTFGERCSSAIVTTKPEKADYTVLLEHEGGKGRIRRDNKFVVSNRDGDTLKSGSTRSLGNAVKDACEVLLKDWQAQKRD